MAEIVLLHAVLGVNPAVRDFAAQLEAGGHTVHVPDLYDGRTFATIDEGIACRDEIGEDELIARSERAVADLPQRLVYAGFSLGASFAQWLGRSRPGAAGVIAIADAWADPDQPWPAAVPLQIHAMRDDDWFELASAEALEQQGDDVEVHLYDGDAHLFTDPSQPGHDPEAAKLLHERVEAFLNRLP